MLGCLKKSGENSKWIAKCDPCTPCIHSILSICPWYAQHCLIRGNVESSMVNCHFRVSYCISSKLYNGTYCTNFCFVFTSDCYHILIWKIFNVSPIMHAFVKMFSESCGIVASQEYPIEQWFPDCASWCPRTGCCGILACLCGIFFPAVLGTAILAQPRSCAQPYESKALSWKKGAVTRISLETTAMYEMWFA